MVAQLTAATIRRLGLGLGFQFARTVGKKVITHRVQSSFCSNISWCHCCHRHQWQEHYQWYSLRCKLYTLLTLLLTTIHVSLILGSTASLIESSNWKTGIAADLCLFEIDEAALPVVAKEVKINSVVVAEFAFGDQLDRFGELDTTATKSINVVILTDSMAIVNSDDPNVSQLAPDVEHLFGLESLLQSASEVIHDSFTQRQHGAFLL